MILQVYSPLRCMNVSINYVYRESNSVADGLVSIGHKETKFILFEQWNQLPIGIKGNINLDRLG